MNGRRRAYTLLEVTVVASMLSLLMLIAATTLHSLYSSARRLRDRTAWQNSVADLSVRLRSDVHAARRVTLRQDAQGVAGGVDVVLEGDTRVQYETDAAGVRRIVHRADSPVHRELFRLPAARHSIRWTISTQPPRRVILLVSEGRSDADAADAASDAGIAVEAVVGLVPAVVTERSKTTDPEREKEPSASNGLSGEDAS